MNSSEVAESCANCGAPLTGSYCASCGQKRFEDSDRRFISLVVDFFDEFFRFDSRWWRSVLALLFRPGVLGRAWIEGRRAHYLKPATLFLFANFLYFFAPGVSDFEPKLHDQLQQVHSTFTRPWVERKIAVRAAAQPGYTMSDYETAFDEKANSISKLLIILHVPFLALALTIFFWRGRFYFAEHFAVALQLFAFLLIFVQLALQPAAVLAALNHGVAPAWVRPPIVAAIAFVPLVYFALALRRTYRCGYLAAAFAALMLEAVLVFANLYVYRFVQFAVTFALT